MSRVPWQRGAADQSDADAKGLCGGGEHPFEIADQAAAASAPPVPDHVDRLLRQSQAAILLIPRRVTGLYSLAGIDLQSRPRVLAMSSSRNSGMEHPAATAPILQTGRSGLR